MSLSRLVEMQRAAKAAREAKESEPAGQSPPASAVGSARESENPEDSPPKETPAPAPKRLPFGNLGNKPKPTPAPAPAPAPAKPKDSLSLDNLGSFDLSSIDESEPESDDIEFSGFHDEIEATAPDRELPEGMDAGMQAFVESLDSIYLILNDSEMFGQQIRQIMMELQENPEYDQLISDTDVHVMIRAMRNTMGLARIKKQAKKRTGRTAKTRTPSKKQALMDKALALSVGIPGMDVD